MDSDGAPTAADLMAPMLKKPLYAATARLLPGRSLEPLLAEHLAFMIALEASGELFAGGPLIDERGTPTGDGLILLRAATLEAARARLAEDPFVAAGIRSVEVQPWRVMEGSVGIRASLSRGTFQFD